MRIIVWLLYPCSMVTLSKRYSDDTARIEQGYSNHRAILSNNRLIMHFIVFVIEGCYIDKPLESDPHSPILN